MFAKWLRTSPSVLSMWPYKIFFTSKFSYLLFSSPTHKTKTGTVNMWETTNTNPRGPIKLSNQSTAGQAGVKLCGASHQPQQTVQKCSAKLTCFDFSSSNFNLQVHILSTGGIALSNSSTMLLAQPAKNYAAPFSQVQHICRTRGFEHNGIMVVAQNCISVWLRRETRTCIATQEMLRWFQPNQNRDYNNECDRYDITLWQLNEIWCAQSHMHVNFEIKHSSEEQMGWWPAWKTAAMFSRATSKRGQHSWLASRFCFSVLWTLVSPEHPVMCTSVMVGSCATWWSLRVD